MTTQPTIAVHLDDAGHKRLALTVAEMQRENPDLSIDDCIAVIFSLGQVTVFSTLTVMTALKEAA